MKKTLFAVLTAMALLAGSALADTGQSIQTTPPSREMSSPAACFPHSTPMPQPPQAAPACNPGPCSYCDSQYDACIAGCAGDATCESGCNRRYNYCTLCCTP